MEFSFDPREASARAALLLRLASRPGEPVSDAELIRSVGGRSLFHRAVTRLISEGERKQSPFIIERDGDALALKRASLHPLPSFPPTRRVEAGVSVQN